MWRLTGPTPWPRRPRPTPTSRAVRRWAGSSSCPEGGLHPSGQTLGLEVGLSHGGGVLLLRLDLVVESDQIVRVQGAGKLGQGVGQLLLGNVGSHLRDDVARQLQVLVVVEGHEAPG